MKFIIKLHPEIIMKSDSVRKRFVKVLTGNIRNVLQTVDENIAVVRHWDFIEVRSKDADKKSALLAQLQCISGIHHILEVEEMPYHDLHDIFLKTLNAVGDTLHNRTFCVRVKRRGKHDFSSVDVMQYVGGGLNQAIETAKVKLKDPDITVNIEIDHDKMFLVKARHAGIGGFPTSTQEDVLSLISGGFDSAVASHMFIRRGSRVHYLFFNLGGKAHEIGVRQMAYQIWQKYSRSHKVKFITVDFEPVVAEILTKIDDKHMGVVLKRMMVRVASRIAQHLKIPALVTGEAMGQVSSQTLTNLHMIDKASETLILRPLITHDKADIIKTAEMLGVADIAKSMPEFCGVISKSPTVKAVESAVLATEQDFDFTILDNVCQNARHDDIRTLNDDRPSDDVVMTNHIDDGEIVLDIRTPDEHEDNPLPFESIHVPFYRLGTQFAELDQSKTYLLYCTKGVMSKLQAVHLKSKGFDNIKVFKRQ